NLRLKKEWKKRKKEAKNWSKRLLISKRGTCECLSQHGMHNTLSALNCPDSATHIGAVRYRSIQM
uniref:Uncharacterized protein n=1 Tax=Parascaris univalens TaxID=6257 RepID=A0A915B6H9_PARUN